MKELNELINTEDPGWPVVQEWLKEAKVEYEVLPKENERANRELASIQLTTRSPMGAIIYETGGILVDHGWIRILGSGSSPRLDRGIVQWNKGKTYENVGDHPTFFLVADDVIGGYYAINIGELGLEMSNVYYLAPDTLEWESLDRDYSGFLNWVFSGDIQKFYELFRWENWKADVEKLNGNETFSFVPFLWTKEGRNIDKVDKRAVSTEENYQLTMEMQKQIAGK